MDSQSDELLDAVMDICEASDRELTDEEIEAWLDCGTGSINYIN